MRRECITIGGDSVHALPRHGLPMTAPKPMTGSGLVLLVALVTACGAPCQPIPEEPVPTEDWEGLANLALRPEAKAAASSVYADGGMSIHQIAHLNDGLYNNPHSWISKGEPSWAEIDLGGEYLVSKVAFGSEHTAHYEDRAATRFSVLVATEYEPDSSADTWHPAFEYDGEPVRLTTCFEFLPLPAHWVRIAIQAGVQGQVRIDELEVYGDPSPVAPARFRARYPDLWTRDVPTPPRGLSPQKRLLRRLFLQEEADQLRRALSRAAPDATLPLPVVPEGPKLDGSLDDPVWRTASTVRRWAARSADWASGPAVSGEMLVCSSPKGLCVALRGAGELAARLATVAAPDGEQTAAVVCRQTGFYLDVVSPGGTVERRQIEGALSADRTTAEVLVPATALPADGPLELRFAVGRHSLPEQGPPVVLHPSGLCVRAAGAPEAVEVGVVPGSPPLKTTVYQQTEGGVRQLADVPLSPGKPLPIRAEPAVAGPFERADLRVAVEGEQPYSFSAQRYAPLAGLLRECREMLRRIDRKGGEVERDQLRSLEDQASEGTRPEREVLFEVRVLRQELAFRRPEIDFGGIVFAKHHPYRPSHIYTEYSDAPYRPGGGIYLLSPLSPTVEPVLLFDGSNGICRDPDVSHDGNRIVFSYREGAEGYYHIYEMRADGSDCRQLTDGRFHDMNPCYLPDGRIAFTSTRARSRVLCFSTPAATLFVTDADGGSIEPLSANNVNDFTPDVMLDGRILYTRWEYLDKGADYIQSLWAMHPDGSNAAQVFGNNLPRPYALFHARQIPGSHRIVCTLGSHWGDHVGPIAVVDPRRGFDNYDAIRNLTPEYPTKIGGAPYQGYRDPYPLSDELFLVSYGPENQFALYLMDATGHKELIHADPEISCFDPIPLRPRRRPPVVASAVEPAEEMATLLLLNVYEGLGDAVPRGAVKYLRIVEEEKHELPRLPNGTLKEHFPNFRAHYASPWEDGRPAPAIAAKRVHGTVPVEPDGSAYFSVPADKPIYFQALDGDFTEVQRMRSYIHPRPGETLTCIGCHEPRERAPAPRPTVLALRRAPSDIQLPAWGGGVFSYKRLVQPVLDRHCVRCHSGSEPKAGLDFSSREEEPGVPISYRTLTRPRTDPPREPLVHFIDNWWGNEASVPPTKPLTFGTVRSDLMKQIDRRRQDGRITPEERLLITTWIDLNCPLWDNYDPELHVMR